MPLGTRLIGSGFPQQLKRCVSFSLYAAKFPHSLIIRLHMELEGSAKLHDRSFLLHCEFYPVLFTKSMKPEDTGPQIDGKGLVIDEWIRDYIHVMDLADGHISALQKLLITDDIGCTAYNLGTGQGTSVLEMVAAFENASGKKIPLKLCPRRPGDATAVYASTEKAQKELGWKAKYRIDDMCRDQWNWARQNPFGYSSQS